MLEGTEQPADFYDKTFKEFDHWCAHYSASDYYPLWAIVADRMLLANVQSVVDIGCGPGQMAMLLFDRGIRNYLGVDFSPARINQARAVCPNFRFLLGNILDLDFLETSEYDCVVCTEVLEHITKDVSLVKRIRPGTRLYASVPNFSAAQHVRFFNSTEEVAERYASYFEDFRVDEVVDNDAGAKMFVVQGIRRAD